MKRKRICTVLALLLSVVVAWFIVGPHPYGPVSPGVLVSHRGYQTNASGQVIPLLAVTNSGSYEVVVMAGTEFGLHSIDFFGSTPTLLKPGEGVLVSIIPSRPYAQSRPVVQWNKRYSHDWVGTTERHIESYLEHGKIVGYIYPEERNN